MNKLTEDLSSEILQHADRPTLLAAARVSPDFRHASQKILFSKIELTEKPKLAACLLSALEMTPRLATYVKALTLTIDVPSPSDDYSEAAYESKLATHARILHIIANVNRIEGFTSRLEWPRSRENVELGNGIQAICQSSNIYKVIIEFTSLSVLQGCSPSLKHLIIYRPHPALLPLAVAHKLSSRRSAKVKPETLTIMDCDKGVGLEAQSGINKAMKEMIVGAGAPFDFSEVVEFVWSIASRRNGDKDAIFPLISAIIDQCGPVLRTMTITAQPCVMTAAPSTRIDMNKLQAVQRLNLCAVIGPGLLNDPIAWLTAMVAQIRGPSPLLSMVIILICKEESFFMRYMTKYCFVWHDLDKLLDNKKVFPQLRTLAFSMRPEFVFNGLRGTGVHPETLAANLRPGLPSSSAFTEMTRGVYNPDGCKKSVEVGIRMMFRGLSKRGAFTVEWKDNF